VPYHLALPVDVHIFAHVVHVVGGRIDGVIIAGEFDQLTVLHLAILHHPRFHAVHHFGFAQDRKRVRVLAVPVGELIAGCQREIGIGAANTETPFLHREGLLKVLRCLPGERGDARQQQSDREQIFHWSTVSRKC
jgi:hypothetical protein